MVIAPRFEQLLVLQGDLTKKRWVQHIQFSGLSFAHTNWTLPPAGQAFPQARASLADHGLANCASGIPIRTYRFRGHQQRRRAPAGACDAGPAKFTIITDGNNLLRRVDQGAGTPEPGAEGPTGLLHRCINQLASIPTIVKREALKGDVTSSACGDRGRVAGNRVGQSNRMRSRERVSRRH